MIVRHLPEHFILFRPRDIVSGDFYWFLEKDDKIFLAAVDCTGHGIPGAFMSLIGSDYLTHIINLQQIEHPTEILNQLHFSITKALKQEETDNRDGMDVAMCVIDKKSNTLQYAGAARPLLYVQDNEMKELLSTKLPIGGFQIETERDFVTYTIPIDRPTTFYIYSDGYQDQFGGPKGRKFAQKKLKSLLFDIHHLPAKEQKKALETTLDDWMQDNRQMDDILIIGVHLSPLHKS
jgi:serine phosphatase RsbU (regulator of sigma subunit)